MKRIHVWTLLGALGAGIAATLLGSGVWGQPDEKAANRVPPPPPITTVPIGLPPPAVPMVSGDPLPPIEAIGLPPLPNSAPPPPGPAASNFYQAPILPVSSPAAPLIPRPEEMPLPSVPVMKIDKDSASMPVLEVRTGRQQPALSVEWVGPSAVRMQQPIPCQLLVRNASASPVHNVVVRQRLPRGVTCKSSEPEAANDAEELIWNLGTLAPEQSRRIDVVLVSQVRGTLNCQATVTFTGIATHQVEVREPQLAVKIRTPDKVVTGETMTLLFGVSNPGDGVAEGVKVKVLLPEGLEHARGKCVDVEVGNLGPKEIRPLQLICVARGSGIQKCTVVITAEGGMNASDTAAVEIMSAKLEAAFTGPKVRYLERHAVYILKVTNPGTAPASSVEVHELLPAGLKLHKSEPRGQYQETTRTVSWTLGDLPPGQSREVTLEVIPVEVGEQRVTAHVKGARGLKAETETNTLVEGLSSLFIELADTDNTIEVGAETAYEVHVTNTGTKVETNVEVVCTLPEQLQFKGAKSSPTTQFRIDGRELIFRPLPRLAPKADVIYRIMVQGTAPGDVRFRARLRADNMREPIVREERTRIYSDDAPVRPATYSAPTGNLAPAPNVGPPSPAPPPAPLTTLPTLPMPGPAPAPLLPGFPQIPMPNP
jgi:uncharacterized repeat protein (TIGR01451 family)